MIDNIGLYRIFYEVACCGSISVAAQRLFVTQPAVSAAVKQLESLLDCTLFFRTNRGIKLTQEGEILLEHVKTAFAALETGEDRLRDITGLSTGLLRVGASDMTLRFYLLDYIAEFNRKYPGVRLSVSNAPTPQTLDSLIRGEIDLGVVSEPVEGVSEIELKPVREIRDILITSSDKYEGREVDFEELEKEKLIMLENGTSTGKYIESQLKENGVSASRLQPDIELATSDLILDFVVKGIGYAFIVEDFAKEYLQSGKLHEIKLRKPLRPRHFMLAYLKKANLTSAARRFIESLEIE